MPINFNITATWRDLNGNIVKVDNKKNLIATVGRAVVASLLAGDSTLSGAITRCALGSSTTAPSLSDTKLGSETSGTRKAPLSPSTNSNKVFITFVYSASEAVGSHKEFGTFIDGADTADSGALFSHLAIDWVKTNQQSLTIDCVYTIS